MNSQEYYYEVDNTYDCQRFHEISIWGKKKLFQNITKKQFEDRLRASIYDFHRIDGKDGIYLVRNENFYKRKCINCNTKYENGTFDMNDNNDSRWRCKDCWCEKANFGMETVCHMMSKLRGADHHKTCEVMSAMLEFVKTNPTIMR
jgi:hypothetical protein